MPDEIVKAIAIPEVRARLFDIGITPAGTAPEQIATVMKSGIEEFGQVMKAAGMQPE